MTQEPYKVRIQNRGNLEVVVHGFKIGVIDCKRMTYLEYRNGKFLMQEVGEHIFDRRIFRIATREDIQRAEIWELVVNKDEFPGARVRSPLMPTLKIFENCIAEL
ncbi:MAG: hypothetical protein IJT36_08715 [Alphaproteobacteria bacterium]|nr:hypothetical protein [Alphaproteobacteria bacterium]